MKPIYVYKIKNLTVELYPGNMSDEPDQSSAVLEMRINAFSGKKIEGYYVALDHNRRLVIDVDPVEDIAAVLRDGGFDIEFDVEKANTDSYYFSDSILDALWGGHFALMRSDAMDWLIDEQDKIDSAKAELVD